MTKLIIENRSNLSDARALQYAMKAAEQYEIARTGSIANQFDNITIHRTKNMNAETFVILETEPVVA